MTEDGIVAMANENIHRHSCTWFLIVVHEIMIAYVNHSTIRLIVLNQKRILTISVCSVVLEADMIHRFAALVQTFFYTLGLKSYIY